jgi:hypothetical protein
MPRPRRDGTKAASPTKKNLSDAFLKRLTPREKTFVVWDARQHGLCIMVQPSGHRAWKCVYRHHSRSRWFHIGDAKAIGLSDARKMAAKIMLQAAEGKDPVAERRAERSRGSFEELANRYRDQYAKKKNKSWQQADKLVRRFLLPKWGKLIAADITRSDVRSIMNKIDAPIVANQTLAAASAIFAWAIRQELMTVNPCTLVERTRLSR